MKNYVTVSRLRKKLKKLAEQEGFNVKESKVFIIKGKRNLILFLDYPGEIDNVVILRKRKENHAVFPYDYFVQSILRYNDYRQNMIFLVSELVEG